jgi:ribosomal protein L37AE/L43A
MSQNRILFQKDMSLDEYIEQYGTDSKCEQALEEARWGRDYACPKCHRDTAHCTFYRCGKKHWQCRDH